MADDLGEDVQAQLDSLKPRESVYSRALKNLMASSPSEQSYLGTKDTPPVEEYTPRSGGRPHDDHNDYKIGHDPGYQRPPRAPSNSSHHRKV